MKYLSNLQLCFYSSYLHNMAQVCINIDLKCSLFLKTVYKMPVKFLTYDSFIAVQVKTRAL